MESFLTTTTINTTLVLAISYSMYKIWSSGSSITSDGQPPRSALAAKQPIVLRNYTPVELSQFNGIDSELIYMAVKGMVFDVSKGRSFYGPNGPYGNFAGHDASRGLAKHSFDKSMLTPIHEKRIDPLDDLSADEVQTLNDWVGQFQSKYQHVGFLVPNE